MRDADSEMRSPEGRTRWEFCSLKVIFEKFLGSDLTTAEIRELKEIDDALLWHDLETLLAEMQHGPMPDLHIKIDFSFRPFKDVERDYLELFYQYYGK